MNLTGTEIILFVRLIKPEILFFRRCSPFSVPILKYFFKWKVVCHLSGGIISYASASSHQTNMRPRAICFLKKSTSSPPVRPKAGSNHVNFFCKMERGSNTFPVRVSRVVSRVPVRKRRLSKIFPFFSHWGASGGKEGRTGPKTPSAPYSFIVWYSRASQSFTGYSSSSMKAIKFPVAFWIALFLANAMFCSGSQS